MKNKSWYEWLLWLCFFVMAGVCVFLNISSLGTSGYANLIINAAMFIIVGFVFIRCDLSAFIPTNEALADLEQAVGKIRGDASGENTYLWDRYRLGAKLFSSESMLEIYADFLDDVKRRENMGASARKENSAYGQPAARTGMVTGDIENYINTDLVDRMMHKNLLNQVAGALTGLGILGTFIGLSLGLQGFATGSTAEITESISPLMDGIKVAFHTSIYGLVFSLVFNYVYKRKVDEADETVAYFLETWHRCVIPDEQTSRLTASDAMREIVNDFLYEMDRSMSGSFGKMAGMIKDESELQKDNAELIRQILDENLVTAKRYTNWLGEQEKTMQNLSRLVGELPQSMERTARAMQETLEQSRIIYGQMLQQVNTAALQLPQKMSEAYVGMESALIETTQSMSILSDRVDSISKQLAQNQVKKRSLFSK